MNTQSDHPSASSAIKKIGILRALNLGDSLCIIPAVRAVKQAYPDAAITLIGLPWQRWFAKRYANYFNDFIDFPGWPGLLEQDFIPCKVTEFLQKVQHIQFDLLLQMQGDGTFTNPMCMLFGAKKVVGLRGAGKYCPDKKYFPVFNEKENEIIQFLHLVNKTLDIPADDPTLEFPLSREEHSGFEKICEQQHLETGRYVCIHPGARDPRRRWSSKKFAFVADKIAEAGYTILITGDEKERKITKAVTNHMRMPAIDLVEKYGAVGLGELALIIKNAVAVLSNDTGVSHLATVMKTPSVIIFTSYSKPERWAPLDMNLHIPVLKQQAHNADVVLDAFCKILHIKSKFVNHESFRAHTYL